ncbi:MAG: cell division ATP-binding protein FtsE [Bdellovibrionales bacterium]|nr:cell division ATP-binding protein FtsE [Bdellovibrionales bacterium]
MSASVVRLFQVGKRYSERYALKNVSFSLREGEFVYITGVSGAGKSTLLKLLFAMERPSEGQVVVNSSDISRLGKRALPNFRQRVGFVFQDFKLLPDLSVFDNVALPLDVRKTSAADVEYRVNGVLNLVGLGDRGRDYPTSLSGGEQQRVAIARSVVSRPSLLLADEPTGNLDSRNAREIMALFREICSMGTTVCIATHDEFLMNEFPARKIELEQGTILSDNRAEFL